MKHRIAGAILLLLSPLIALAAMSMSIVIGCSAMIHGEKPNLKIGNKKDVST